MSHASLLVFGRTASRFHLSLYQTIRHLNSFHARVDDGERVGFRPPRPRFNDAPMHPKVDLVVCEGGPDSLEVLPRHVHV